MSEKKPEKKNRDNNSSIFTRETLGMVIIVLLAFLLLILFTGSGVFGGFGKTLCTFFYGTFGYGSYLLVALGVYAGVYLTFERKIDLSFSVWLFGSLAIYMLFVVFHTATTHSYELSGYGAYLSDCYLNASDGWSGYTFGGVFSGIFSYPFMKSGGNVLSYILYSILAVLFGYLTVMSYRGKIAHRGQKGTVFSVGGVRESEEKTKEPTDERADDRTDDEPLYARPRHEEPRYEGTRYEESQYVEPPEVAQQPTSADILFSPEPYPAEDKSDLNDKLGSRILFETPGAAAESYRSNLIYNESSYFNHPVTNTTDDYLKGFEDPTRPHEARASAPASAPEPVRISDPASDTRENPVSYTHPFGTADESSDEESERPAPKPFETFFRAEPISDDETRRGSVPDEPAGRDRPIIPDEPTVRMEGDDFFSSGRDAVGRRRDDLFGESPRTRFTPSAAGEDENDEMDRLFLPDSDEMGLFGRRRRGGDDLFGGDAVRRGRDISGDETRSSFTPIDRDSAGRTTSGRTPISIPTEYNEPEPTPAPEPKHVWKKYVRPPMDLLTDYPETNSVNTAEIEDNKATIVETLCGFNIDCEIENVTVGPAVTRYDLKVYNLALCKKAAGYSDELAMALRKDKVSSYMNTSNGVVSVEVPNSKRSTVGLKSVMASQKFINSAPGGLFFALGKDVDGECYCPDITEMPHLLIAGTTGSGKSVCLSSLLVSLLYKYGPEDLRLILVDPKQVEFMPYDKLPHLVVNEIITDVDKTLKALNWAIKEMERRYTLFRELSKIGKAAVKLDEYNANVPTENKLPKIVIVLDEFGDLMLQAKKDIESKILKLVQKGRAAGIHLILATQRPSVDCITGLIKSNLPTKIGFKVNSIDDSKVIFDYGGAEKLLGKGDMYIRTSDAPDLVRLQCCFIEPGDVVKVTDFVKCNNESYFDKAATDFINAAEDESDDGKSSKDAGGAAGRSGDGAPDDKTLKALKLFVETGQASINSIQRRFPVGYVQACKMIDWMESKGYVSPSEGSKSRKVLLTMEEFVNLYGDVDDD